MRTLFLEQENLKRILEYNLNNFGKHYKQMLLVCAIFPPFNIFISYVINVVEYRKSRFDINMSAHIHLSILKLLVAIYERIWTGKSYLAASSGIRIVTVIRLKIASESSIRYSIVPWKISPLPSRYSYIS